MAAKSKFTAATLAELGPAKLAELIVEEAQANPAFRKRDGPPFRPIWAHGPL